ncbi:MAG: hypothetical protein JWR10_2648 [Rubritepida sp.]|nr:hypothetical protein [Rubritepida sp.]
MRALLSVAVLASLTGGAAQAAEPSMSYTYSLLPAVNVEACMQRSRNAITANGATLAEGTSNSQFGTRGDYLILVSCAPAQPTVFFISVAGPHFPEASQLSQGIRNSVTGAGTAPGTAPPSGGTK